MSSVRSIFFYLSTASLYMVCFSFDRSQAIKEVLEKNGIPYILGYGGRFKFLTHITLAFQIIYFNLCLIISFCEFFIKNSSAKLKSLRNIFFINIIWPYSAFVTLTFWGLYLMNRELIYPKGIEEAIPHWQNHIMHTFPIVTALIESYCVKHSYSKSLFKGALPTIGVGSIYVAWTFYIAFHGGFWVYPILQVLSNFYRIIFISILLVFSLFLYKIGETINSFFWPKKRLIVKKND